MNKKKIFALTVLRISLLFICSALIFSCSDSGKKRPVYLDDIRGYEITGPEGWTKEYDSFGRAIMFVKRYYSGPPDGIIISDYLYQPGASVEEVCRQLMMTLRGGSVRAPKLSTEQRAGIVWYRFRVAGEGKSDYVGYMTRIKSRTDFYLAVVLTTRSPIKPEIKKVFLETVDSLKVLK